MEEQYGHRSSPPAHRCALVDMSCSCAGCKRHRFEARLYYQSDFCGCDYCQEHEKMISGNIPYLNDVQKTCSGPEFAIGTVVGWRAFLVDRHGRLSGTTNNRSYWRPNEEMEATCIPTNQRRPCNGPSPNPTCTCGFYAYYDFDHTVNIFKNSNAYISDESNPMILGLVEGYGRTFIGDKGFRCEKAKLLGLHLPRFRERRYRRWFSLCVREHPNKEARLRAVYHGVPILSSWRRLERMFPPTGAPVITPEEDPHFWTRE